MLPHNNNINESRREAGQLTYEVLPSLLVMYLPEGRERDIILAAFQDKETDDDPRD